MKSKQVQSMQNCLESVQWEWSLSHAIEQAQNPRKSLLKLGAKEANGVGVSETENSMMESAGRVAGMRQQQ